MKSDRIETGPDEERNPRSSGLVKKGKKCIP